MDKRTTPTNSETAAQPETILVVDDEQAIRDLTCEYLRAKGYEVLQATNAAEALRIFSERREGIHLMLTDMIMPGGNGPDLAAAVGNMGLRVAVIFMSGDADRSLDREILGKDAVVLQKPFSLAALARLIRSAMEKRTKAATLG